MTNNQLSKTLTAAFRDKTLPEGWYYFRCGVLKPQIGYYQKPTLPEVAVAQQTGRKEPEPIIYSHPTTFIGSGLNIIQILAPVPDYPDDDTEEAEQCKCA